MASPSAATGAGYTQGGHGERHKAGNGATPARNALTFYGSRTVTRTAMPISYLNRASEIEAARQEEDRHRY